MSLLTKMTEDHWNALAFQVADLRKAAEKKDWKEVIELASDIGGAMQVVIASAVNRIEK